MSSYYWENQCLHPVIIHASVLTMLLTDVFRDTKSSWGKENCQWGQQDPGTPKTTGKHKDPADGKQRTRTSLILQNI